MIMGDGVTVVSVSKRVAPSSDSHIHGLAPVRFGIVTVGVEVIPVALLDPLVRYLFLILTYLGGCFVKYPGCKVIPLVWSIFSGQNC